MNSPSVLDAVERTSLPSVIVQKLRTAIVSGALRPGEHLAENSLARQLGVSRGPVRDALRHLEREGLVVVIPNRGSYVRQFTARDVDEIYSLRTMVEVLAAQWAIPRLSQSDLQELERLRKVHEVASQCGDELAYDADIAFHEYVCQRAEHERLMRIWEGLRSQCFALFHLQSESAFAASPDLSTAVADHLALLEAIAQRDVEKAVLLHTANNERVRQKLRRVLEGVQATSYD